MPIFYSQDPARSHLARAQCLALVASTVLLALLSGCGKHEVPPVEQAKCKSEADCIEALAAESKKQADLLTKACCEAAIPTRRFVVIGNGIAGAAAALNLSVDATTEAANSTIDSNIDARIRVYGSPSFWRNLEGLPEVWQTSFEAPFKAACLFNPALFDDAKKQQRIQRPSMQVVNMEALLRAEADYLETGPVSVSRTIDGRWLVVDADGRREIADQALIIATGLLRPLLFTDLIPGPEARETRRALRQESKIFSGDEFLRQAPNIKGKVVGVLGAGGNAADVVKYALDDGGASQVVVWGKVPGNLSKTASYKALDTRLGSTICRIKDYFSAVAYDSVAIHVSAGATVCDGTNNQPPLPEVLVESLGRYEGDPPAEVVKAAKGLPVSYKPEFINSSNRALIAVRVVIGDDKKHEDSVPMYLIGAAATWIPASVEMSSNDYRDYQAGLAKTVELMNPDQSNPENPPPGFAVAAFMGSELGGKLSGKIVTPCPTAASP